MSEPHALRLVRDEPPPPLAELDGRRIRWERWKIAPRVTHITHKCDRCGFTGLPRVAVGVLSPRPGGTWPGERVKRLPSGRSYLVDYERPAWPVRRLFAYR
jgi:hypothetical protein